MGKVVLVLLAVVLLSTAAFAAPAKGPAPDPGLVRTQIKDILSAPEYNRILGHAKGKTIEELIAEKIAEFVRWLMRVLKFGGGVGKNLSALLAWGVIALFIVLFLAAAIRLLGRPHAGVRLGGPDAAEGFELPSSSRLMADAAKCAEAGDYRGAFLQAYLGSIAYLDEVNALRFERSRTNWEYLRDLNNRGMEPLAEELRPLTSDFDRKLYGHDRCSRGDYDKAVATYEQVRRMAA